MSTQWLYSTRWQRRPKLWIDTTLFPEKRIELIRFPVRPSPSQVVEIVIERSSHLLVAWPSGELESFLEQTDDGLAEAQVFCPGLASHEFGDVSRQIANPDGSQRPFVPHVFISMQHTDAPRP